MKYELFQKYSDAIRQSAIDGFAGSPLPSSLLMHEESGVSVYYAPFDYVNTNAKLVIVGITPGLTQAVAALRHAGSSLAAGLNVRQILEGAKTCASFSGPMRSSLVSMMDRIGLNERLGIESTARLFDQRSDMVHFTSVLRYPVFVSGQNYNGQPSMRRVNILKESLRHFVSEIDQLGSALFLPLGKVPNETLTDLVHHSALPDKNVLFGFPHPSSANSERIAYFLGKKSKDSLSVKTNPEKIDQDRAQLTRKVSII